LKRLSVRLSLVLAAAILVFSVSSSYLSRRMPSAGELAGKINPVEALAVSMTLELRQIIASITWLRVDEYFHSSARSMRYNTEIVPLLRLVTLFDHSFVDAYLVLAFHLADHLNRQREALEILKEGIAGNLRPDGRPTSGKISELFFEAGWINVTHFHDTSEAAANIVMGEKFITPECDTDNVFLARKLLYYIRGNSTEEIKFDLKPKMIGGLNFDGGATAAISLAESVSAESAVKKSEGGEDGTGVSDLYAGRNPWNNPGLRKDLKCLSLVYVLASLIFLSFARFFAFKRKNK